MNPSPQDSPKTSATTPKKSERRVTPRSRLPIPDYDLALGAEVEKTLALYELGVPGEVNHQLVDAMREALYEPHSADRSRQWLILMGAMRPEDAPEIRELFREGDKNGVWFVEQWLQFYDRWGQIDGPAAIADITAKPNPGLGETVKKAAGGWAASDPHSALEWLSDWDPKHPHWNDVASAMIGGFAQHDLPAATLLSAEMNAKMDAENWRLIQPAMEQLADAAILEGGISAVTDWITMYPEKSGLQTAAFGQARYRVERAGREPLAQWLDSQSDRPYRRDYDYRDLANKWAQDNVADALDWATSLSPSPHNGSYTGLAEILKQADQTGQREIVQEWAEANPQHQAADSLNQLLQTTPNRTE